MKAIQVITEAPATSKRAFRTYKFNSIENARLFVSKWNLESKIVDIIM